MERGMCIVPITFENEKTTDSTMKNWLEKIRSNDGSMDIPDPSYIPTASGYNNIIATDRVETNGGDVVRIAEFNNPMVPAGDDCEQYAYFNQKGKRKADFEADLCEEKMKENTVVSYGFSQYGYIRGKAFADGSRMCHTIAYGRIEEVQRWIIAGKEYARLLIEDTTPGFKSRKAEWTNVIEVSDLEKDKYIEELLSRYFKPSDSRAYNKISIKDFRSRIYEAIYSVVPEVVQDKTGWYKYGSKRFYHDGSQFPNSEHTLGRLRRSCSRSNITIEETLNGICKELDEIDVGSRLSFLIGYGMITWFSDVCFLNWSKRPGVMILGREDVCRRYADACLKMYVRADGSDIIQLAEMDKKSLVEYADALKDDAFVLNCNNAFCSAILKTIVSGRSIANRRLDVPIVTLQNIPDKALNYEDYVTVDLNGYKISEPFCLYMQELKVALLSIFENNQNVDNEVKDYKFASYEEAVTVVLSTIKHHLFSAGVSVEVLNRFFGKLEKGISIKRCFCGNTGDTLVHMLQQRLEKAIESGKLSVAGEVKIGTLRDLRRSLIVEKGSVYIPVKYFEEVLLSLLNLSISDFHRVRNALIERGLLDTYDVGRNYAKRITVSKGERVYAYQFKRTLFIPLDNKNIYKMGGEDRL